MSRKRVVVLARAGVARERTEAAIAQAGADVAALLDPASASEADVRDAAPDVLLVILDPLVEHALDKFDGVLGDPALEILFDDADVLVTPCFAAPASAATIVTGVEITRAQGQAITRSTRAR